MKASDFGYIHSIFNRADFQHIRNFILNGTEDVIDNIEITSYQEKLKSVEKQIYKRFENLYPQNGSARDAAIGELSDALCVTADIYAEIGMQIGAQLLYDLLLRKNNIISDKSEKG